MAHKIHVLLVEHDNNDHDNIKNMLGYCAYKVTTTKLASTAISNLSKGKDKFDVVMANMDSPDTYSFELLQLAVQMDLFVILMSDYDDSVTIMRAIEQGASLCVKKPVSAETIVYLWQHVLRQKVRKLVQNQRFGAAIEYNNNEDPTELGYNRNNNNTSVEKTCIASNKNKKYGSSSSLNSTGNVLCKKKAWTDWNEALHEKFMAAVIQLGEGRCYPKDILEVMNVPGLTRMQVASHLQKYRNANRLPPPEIESEAIPPKNKAQRTKTEKFGSMPRIFSYSEFRARSRKYNKLKNIHQELIITDPPTESDNNVHGISAGGYTPPLVQDQFTPQHNEAFYVGQLEQTFGLDNNEVPFNYNSNNNNNVTTFEFPNTDPMIQDLSVMHHELGMGYSGNFPSLVLDHGVNLNQMATMSNATNDMWSQEIAESVNDDQETEG